MCQQCDDSPCTHVCPTGASYRDENNVVLVDKEKCIGCKYCMMACPYGVRSWSPSEHVVEKCTLCGQLTSVGEEPKCVAACCASARFYGDLDDPNSDASKALAAAGADSVHRLKDVGNGPQTAYILSAKYAESERGGEVMDIQWSLVLFTALTGMGGWLFFFICLNVFVRKTDKGAFAGTATALALTVVGGLASVTHLSHPDRMLGALQHPTSGIFTEALLVGLLAIVMIAFLVMLRRGIDGGALKAVAVVGMALGALMSFMAGQSYLMSAIAAWNTELLPLGYLGTAAASGAAAYLVLIAAQKADENACSLYGLMTLAAGCVALITVLAYGAVAGAFAGDAAPMTIAAAAFGGVAPIACGFLARKKPGSAVALGAVALIAALIGSIAFRCAMWVIGAGLYDFFGLI